MLFSLFAQGFPTLGGRGALIKSCWEGEASSQAGSDVIGAFSQAWLLYYI